MPFGNLLTGYLAKVFTAPATLFGEGLVLGVFALYITFFRPEVRTFA